MQESVSSLECQVQELKASLESKEEVRVQVEAQCAELAGRMDETLREGADKDAKMVALQGQVCEIFGYITCTGDTFHLKILESVLFFSFAKWCCFQFHF